MAYFELVFEDGEIDEHLLLARYMCQASGRGLSLITLQRPGYPADAYRDILHALEDAQSEGIDMRGQVAPRPIGVLMSLGSRLNPLRASETFMAIATTALGHIELARPEVRDRILEEAQVGSQMLDRFPFLFELGDPPRYHQSRDEDLRSRAVMANTTAARSRLRNSRRRRDNLRTSGQLHRRQLLRYSRDARPPADCPWVE